MLDERYESRPPSFLPLRAAIAQVESDQCCLSEGLEVMVKTLSAVPNSVKEFAPGDFRKATAIVKERLELFLKPHSVLANVLDHRFRGQQIPTEAKAAAFKELPRLSESLGLSAPSLDDVADFVAGRGLHVLLGVICFTYNHSTFQFLLKKVSFMGAWLAAHSTFGLQYLLVKSSVLLQPPCVAFQVLKRRWKGFSVPQTGLWKGVPDLPF